MNNRTTYVAQGALVAALYILLTFLSNLFGLASGIVQIRLSETLTILPIFIPAAMPGLFVGCIISNLITGCAIFDVIFGALATLVGAYGTYFIGHIHLTRPDNSTQSHRQSKFHRYLASLPPIAANTLIIPWILSIVYSFDGSIWYFTATVFVGELISAGVLGQLLAKMLEPHIDRLKI